jgi:hypothetical protein
MTIIEKPSRTAVVRETMGGPGDLLGVIGRIAAAPPEKEGLGPDHILVAAAAVPYSLLNILKSLFSESSDFGCRSSPILLGAIPVLNSFFIRGGALNRARARASNGDM